MPPEQQVVAARLAARRRAAQGRDREDDPRPRPAVRDAVGACPLAAVARAALFEHALFCVVWL